MPASPDFGMTQDINNRRPLARVFARNHTVKHSGFQGHRWWWQAGVDRPALNRYYRPRNCTAEDAEESLVKLSVLSALCGDPCEQPLLSAHPTEF